MSFSTLDALPWQQHFSLLGDEFYSVVKPTPLTQPYWIHLNKNLVSAIGLTENFNKDQALSILSGQQRLKQQAPLAMVYAGHQFGGYSPQLGDGRGLLIGQFTIDNSLMDMHLKGAGKTPYSRFGDGRAVLRSSIREYLVGEAMHALGIPTSRALAIVGGINTVIREQEETAAIVTRLAKTHIRFGHFEYFYYENKHPQLQQLADHVIQQFIPDAHQHENPYETLLQYTVTQTAEMIAKWQSVGFAHGVMNTDNMSIIGETLDYGPYGFLDDYEPGFICNHSDHHGRYAFDQQPSIGLWNLNALAHALSPLISSERISDILSTYETTLVNHYAELMRQKFGLAQAHKEDHVLCANILHLLSQDKVDYTQFFRYLSHLDINDPDTQYPLEQLFNQHNRWQEWLLNYQRRLTIETSNTEERLVNMRKKNPKYILRNYLVQQAIDKAKQQDFSEIDTLLHLISSPFDEHESYEDYAKAPPAWGKHLPISCSS